MTLGLPRRAMSKVKFKERQLIDTEAFFRGATGLIEEK